MVPTGAVGCDSKAVSGSLSEYDLRSPMRPTGTSLLGLVKHLASMEYAYLGATFARPVPEAQPWAEGDTFFAAPG
jgi:hypothetical protein